MENENTMVQEQEKCETKLLGAHVDENIYWAFKRASAGRQETMAEAITHAALMYINIKEGHNE